MRTGGAFVPDAFRAQTTQRGAGVSALRRGEGPLDAVEWSPEALTSAKGEAGASGDADVRRWVSGQGIVSTGVTVTKMLRPKQSQFVQQQNKSNARNASAARTVDDWLDAGLPLRSHASADTVAHVNTNSPVSNALAADDNDGDDDAAGLVHFADPRLFYLRLPRPLHSRIVDLRCEAMLTAGLLQETLLHSSPTAPGTAGGALPAGSARAKSIGYAQALGFFESKVALDALAGLSSPDVSTSSPSVSNSSSDASDMSEPGAKLMGAEGSNDFRLTNAVWAGLYVSPRSQTPSLETDLGNTSPSQLQSLQYRPPAPAPVLQLFGRFLGEFQRGTRALARKQAAWVRASHVFYELDVPVSAAGFLEAVGEYDAREERAAQDRKDREKKSSKKKNGNKTASDDANDIAATVATLNSCSVSASSAAYNAAVAAVAAGCSGLPSICPLSPCACAATPARRRAARAAALAEAALCPPSHVPLDVLALSHPDFAAEHKAALRRAAGEVADSVAMRQGAWWDSVMPAKARLEGREWGAEWGHDSINSDTNNSTMNSSEQNGSNEENESSLPVSAVAANSAPKRAKKSALDQEMKTYIPIPLVYTEKDVIIGLRGAQLPFKTQAKVAATPATAPVFAAAAAALTANDESIADLARDPSANVDSSFTDAAVTTDNDAVSAATNNYATSTAVSRGASIADHMSASETLSGEASQLMREVKVLWTTLNAKAKAKVTTNNANNNSNVSNEVSKPLM